MRPDLPWNVAGIPPEAREAARAAARRDGLSVGEWLTRRILHSFSDADTDDDSGGEWAPRMRPEGSVSRQDTEEMLAHVTRSETDSKNANRRIEEQMRAVARRMDANERSQSENSRAMSKAAAEISIATREQSQAFEQLGSNVTSLGERIDRVERHAASDGVRDAVRGLHQGLTRLADQVSQSASHSATQISAVTDSLEALAGKLNETKNNAEMTARLLDSRNAQLEERVRGIEKLAEQNASELARSTLSAATIGRLEEGFARLEARSSDPSLERRLNAMERTLADLASRPETPVHANAPIEDSLRVLAQRVEATEKSQREAASELRQAIAALTSRSNEPLAAAVVPIPVPAPVAAPVSVPVSPPPIFDAPPFTETSNFPANAPKIPSADGFLPPFSPAEAPLAHAEPAQAAGFMGDVPSPAPDSFLAAARRSAQAAAMQAEAERMNRGLGGFAWGSQMKTRSDRPPTRYGFIGLVALAVILLAVAGILFTGRLATPTFSSANGAASPTPLVSAPVVLKPSSPQGDTASSIVRPAAGPAVAAPTPASSATPATSLPRTAPSSPVLPALKTRRVASAPIHRVPAPPQVLPAEKSPTAPARPIPAQANPAQQTAPMPALDRVSALANAGNAKAETIVGLRYLDGNGVPVNEAEASKWLQRAADHGQAVAQYRLGTLYERGRGVPADGAKAIHWYQAAAQAGNRKAMHNLAVAYAQGTGVPKDFAEAARWFSKAAALGLADSQFNLAVLYERGLGVPQSLLDAYKWYAIAAAQGDAESRSRIDAIATQLSADDRAAAQRSADQFKPSPLDAAANVSPQISDIAG